MRNIAISYDRISVVVRHSALALTLAMGLCAGPAHAIAISITNLDHFSELQNAPPNSFVPTPGEFRQLEVDVTVRDSSGNPVLSGVTVTAENSNDPGNIFTMSAYDDPLFQGHFIEIPFDATLAAGTWTVNATTSDGMTATGTIGPHFPLLVDLVTDVIVSGAALTPTISWTLPSQPLDRMRVRVMDQSLPPPTAIGNFFPQIFQQNLAATATEFTIPIGLLQADGDYIFRILAESFGEDDSTFNRSGFFIAYSVPEPSTLMLMGIGLAGLGWMRRRKKTNH